MEQIANWNNMQLRVTFFVLNSLDKSHLDSVCTQYVCDKSENARVCVKWQRNALDWCYRRSRECNPVTQSRMFHSHFAHTRAFSPYNLRHFTWSCHTSNMQYMNKTRSNVSSRYTAATSSCQHETARDVCEMMSISSLPQCVKSTGRSPNHEYHRHIRRSQCFIHITVTF